MKPRAVWDEVRGAADDAVRDAVEYEVGAAAQTAADDAIRDAVWYAVGIPVGYTAMGALKEEVDREA